MQWNASATDGTVSKSANSDAMYAHVAGSVGERMNVTTAGVHGDPCNYGYLRVGGLLDRINGVTPEYTVAGPTTGASGQASSAYTLSLANASFTDLGSAAQATISSSLTFDGQYSITLTDVNDEVITATDVGGTITGNGTKTVSIQPANGHSSFTFVRTPSNGGTKSISITNNQGWSNPNPMTYLAIGGVLRRNLNGRSGSRGM